MKHIKKQVKMLALLLGAATGAWAQDDIQVTQVQGQANQWQYIMPDVDVELTVKYFPMAAFSEGGQPTAIPDVIAGTDNPIVNMGQSQHGTVMYYATTDATAPDFNAAGWTSTVPTAAIVKGDRTESTEVYVYYYIKGNDAPEGETATADNTFSDTDILGPLTITLKKNLFNVAIRPATQFSADGGQATVTVDGQSTDNYSLKQGQTITVAAAKGYKIRTAKMGGAVVPVGEVTKGDLGKLVGGDGKIYADMAAAVAAGTGGFAQIVYVGSNTGVKGCDRGLAIDTDNGLADYGIEIPGTQSLYPSQAQWNTMFDAAGGYQALNEGMIAKCGDTSDFLYYYNEGWGEPYYYSTDVDSNGERLCFNFLTGEWVTSSSWSTRSIRAIAPAAALSGDDATLNDAKTVATYTVPDHDASVKYLLARDLTYQVAFAGIPTEPVSVTMGPDGNYQPATPLDIQLNDAGADIIGADGLTVSYERQGDGDNWTAAVDFLTDMQPGTYRIVAAATDDEMSPYDGSLTSATFTLADNGIRLDEAADNSPALATKNGQQANVTLTRTLQAGGYNTFAVPFSMAKPEGWTVKELSSASFADGVLTLNFTPAASIVAGKPYLVKVSTATDLSASAFTGVTISKDAKPFTSTNVDFIPTLGATTIGSEGDDAKTVLFLGAGNKLYNPEALPADMKGFRAYFQLKGDAAAEARAFRMDFGDGETTGIKEIYDLPIYDLQFNSSSCYDLSGRKIVNSKSVNGKLQKGVYIVNGKKKVIK